MEPCRCPRLAVGLVVALILTVWAAAHAGEEGFIADFDDLPLMPGFEEVPGLGVVFDKPEGRIVEAFARGRRSEAEVAAFYRETLPQLGWSAGDGHSYAREDEVLTLEFETTGGWLTIHFSISPR